MIVGDFIDNAIHPPKEMIWHPPIRLHLKRWNPLFWLVHLFGSDAEWRFGGEDS